MVINENVTETKANNAQYFIKEKNNFSEVCFSLIPMSRCFIVIPTFLHLIILSFLSITISFLFFFPVERKQVAKRRSGGGGQEVNKGDSGGSGSFRDNS